MDSTNDNARRRKFPDGSEGSEQETNVSTKKSKYDRSARACLVCRNRKVKCDALLCRPNRCTNCVEFNIKECIIPELKKRRSKKIEELLKSDENVQLLTDTDDKSKEERTENRYPEYVGPSLQEKYPEMNHITLDPRNTLKFNVKSIIDNTESVDWCGSFPREVLLQYMEENVNLKSPVTIDSTDYDSLIEAGCFKLPPIDQCWKWINAFFKKRSYQYPVILEKQFREEYKDLTNPPSLLLLQSILYAGARYYDEEEWDLAQHKQLMDKSDILYKRAKLLYDKKVEHDTLRKLQSVLLLANYKSRNKLDVRMDFTYIRTSLDLCYALGIHKNPDLIPKISSDTKRLYKRIWWTLFILDTLYSFVLHRPWAIDCIFTSDVPMITEEDLRSDINDSSKDDSFETLYFIHRVKLNLCVRKICESVFKIANTPKASTLFSIYLAECDQMMRDWIEQLPDCLLFKINSSSNNAFNAGLSLEYYSALLLLHKIHITNNQNFAGSGEKKYPSWGIVFKAAHMTAVISRYMIETRCVSLSQNLIPYAMIIAGLMMIYHLYNTDKTVHRIAKDDIETFLELLYKVSVDYPYAYICYYIFKSIYEDKAKQCAMLNPIIFQNKKTKKQSTENDISLKSKDFTSDILENGKGKQGLDTATHQNESKDLGSGTKSNFPLVANSIVPKVLTNIPVSSIMFRNIPKVSELLSSIPPVNSNIRNAIQPSSNSILGGLSNKNFTLHHNVPFEQKSEITSSSGRNDETRSGSLPKGDNSETSSHDINQTYFQQPKQANKNINTALANSNFSVMQSVKVPSQKFPGCNNPLDAQTNPVSLYPSLQQEGPNCVSNVPQYPIATTPSNHVTQAFPPQNLAVTSNLSSNNLRLQQQSQSQQQLPLQNAPLTAQTLLSNTLHTKTEAKSLKTMPLLYPHQRRQDIPLGQNSPGLNPFNQPQTPTNINNQTVVSQKFDLVMPLDLVPGMNMATWQPEFDTSSLLFENADQIYPQFEFDNFFQELGI